MKFEKLVGGGIVVTTTANTFSIENGAASAEGTLNDTVIIRRYRQVLYVLPYTDIQKADNSFATSTDDAVAYLSDVFATLGSGGGSGITDAKNGLKKVGTDVKLGGDLIENTVIKGNYALTLGTKSDPLNSLASFSQGQAFFQANNGVDGLASLNLAPNAMQLVVQDTTNTAFIAYQGSFPEGFLVKDDIANIGLRGASLFPATNDLDFVQKQYVDGVITGALIPKGNWDSLTNTPTLTSSTSPGGNYLYYVSVASSGVTNLD